MIVDTSVLLAFFDSKEPDHAAARIVIEGCADPLVVSPYVVAELDYLVSTRIGVAAELATIRELSGGAWELPAFGRGDLEQAASVIAKYRDQPVGLADASNVILAERYQTRTIATLDRRHFDVLRPLRGGRFSIVP